MLTANNRNRRCERRASFGENMGVERQAGLPKIRVYDGVALCP